MRAMSMRRCAASGTTGLVDAVVRMHAEIYAEPRFGGDPYFADRSFRDRLMIGLRQPGFELLLAELAGEPAGCFYGWALPSYTRWWTPLKDTLPSGMTAETGDRTVFIQEIMVRAPWRGRGIARRMHDDFLTGRSEERALLCVQPDNEPARSAYLRWGWEWVATTRFGAQSPVFDCLVKPLR
ncbi:GNAT superfamily N-acetyltransferase [Kibdelosporangium phytohabitans]|uniref:N-acetyltransferase domain-containing protein n=2 Tax=Kibdelosporangium phytohabitans TaxID=860235 RepID=A0A0N9HYD1_9PSEU|nr:hypothetical protein AOZ06_29290 [Kibdelosporangium phytohabitans]MBE1461516.1 GNAT superfamily N-acetyltransferase [Kibdelosporangium phytohabitans]